MQNIGTADRILRFTFGVFFLIFAWWQSSWIALAFALFAFYEALTSWCILYHLLGKNTCSLSHKNQSQKQLLVYGFISAILLLFLLGWIYSKST